MVHMKEKDTIIDIESCLNTIIEPDTPDISNHEVGENTFSFIVCGLPMNIDDLAKCSENSQLSPSAETKNVGGLISPNLKKNARNEKRFSMSAKKPPKPPRPPRGPSLDAADQKLIKEISELAMIKRARVERVRALRKMRAGGKASSGSASTSGNLIAMVLTILFCVVIIFQGCHPLRILPRNSPTTKIIPPSTPKGASEPNLYGGVDQYRSSSTTNLHARAPGLDNKDDAKQSPY